MSKKISDDIEAIGKVRLDKMSRLYLKYRNMYLNLPDPKRHLENHGISSPDSPEGMEKAMEMLDITQELRPET